VALVKRGCLKDRAYFATTGSIAGKQLVEKRLSLGTLTTFVERPMSREASQIRPDLLASQRHRGSRSDGEALLIRDSIEGPLKQPAVLLA
jgi:hypothetical protein